MTSPKLVNLLALLSVACVGLSFGPTPANALSAGHAHQARHVDHHVVAKKRRGASNKRCKQRPSSSLGSSVASTTTLAAAAAATTTHHADTTTAAPTTTAAATTTTPKTTTSSGSSAPSTVQNGKAQCKGKVGYAWPNGDWIDIEPWVTADSCYVYTWGETYPSKSAALGLRPMPMLWGGAQDKIDAFNAAINSKDNIANLVMGFNEPNEDSPQSNMSPEWAAQVWLDNIQPLRARGFKTVCPGTSSNPNGLTWVQNFLKACVAKGQSCDCDYHSVHYYDVTVSGFKTYVQNWYNTFQKPLFVTEFACQNFNGGAQCSPSEIDTFWREVIAWMNDQDWIEGYMGFGAMHDMYNVNTENQLMGSDGKPNAFGQKYVAGY